MGIQVQIKDRKKKVSKTFTVRGLELDNIFYKILFFSKRLEEGDEIKVVCYKEKGVLK